ncbi:MAG: general secretion pathway protein GspK [Lentisphaeria bacterium]|nr:general secretion pathway protein GspK [Lentisphaeria bacterium]
MSAFRRQRGSVLVLTLWLAAGLCAAALMAGHTAVLRHRRDAHLQASLEADHAVEGMLRYLLEVLGDVEEEGTLPDRESYEAEDVAIGNCRVWLLGRGADVSASAPTYALEDECSRLNLNRAEPEMLEALPGMTAEFAAAIGDWIDEDADISAGGAESETYLALDPPYVAKDANVETVDEIRLVNGVEALILTGRDRNRNTIVEPWERDFAEEYKERFQDVADLGVLAFLTVHSREPNLAADGSERVDLNGNPQQVRQTLVQLFGSRGTVMAADAGVGSTRFRSVLEFCLRAGVREGEADQAFDRLTVDSGSRIVGRVNVNTAPVDVLACLPGVGSDVAESLVAYRGEGDETPSNPMWLAGAVGEDVAVAMGPYVTARSYQVAADIVAVHAGGHAFRRIRFVIDTTTGSPVVVSRRDLTNLGWPLGEELYRELVAPLPEDES